MIEAYDQGNVELTKRVLEITMAVILLASAFLLPRQQGMLADSKKVSEIQNNNGTQKVVVLDAGHGAADSGKVGVHGELEKDINLAITKKLQYYLEQENVKVVLTREDDSPLYSTTDSNKKMADMKARIEAIEEANPEIVVSIHQNSYTAESVSGPQVFYYTGSQKGEMLADTLQKRFDYVLGDQNRRSIKANKDYYLLIHVPCPIVIVECGFLSNSAEANLLSDPSYQDKIAWTLHMGILQYLNGESS